MNSWLQHLKGWKRPLQFAVAISLLCALYWVADWREVAAAVGRLNPMFLLVAWALFVPQTLVSAWRWQQIVKPAGEPSLSECLKATLAAAAFNLVIPSKLGDVNKLSVVPAGNRKSGILWLALEKGFDVGALLVLISLGLLGCGWLALTIVLAAVAGTCSLVARTAIGPPLITRWAPVIGTSAMLWCLHMLQIDLFCKAAGVFVAGDFALWRIPLAIFAGLVPLTMWGLGTRDAALVALFAGVAPSATMATVGLLTATRYLIPGVVGIPCIITRKVGRQSAAGAV